MNKNIKVIIAIVLFCLLGCYPTPLTPAQKEECRMDCSMQRALCESGYNACQKQLRECFKLCK